MSSETTTNEPAYLVGDRVIIGMRGNFTPNDDNIYDGATCTVTSARSEVDGRHLVELDEKVKGQKSLWLTENQIRPINNGAVAAECDGVKAPEKLGLKPCWACWIRRYSLRNTRIESA